MPGFKATRRGVKAIKKTKEREPHQHVTNEVFQGHGEMINVDAPAPLGLFLDDAENQRRTKRP